MTQNVSLRELIIQVLEQIKEALKEYAQKQEGAMNRRGRTRLLIGLL